MLFFIFYLGVCEYVSACVCVIVSDITGACEIIGPPSLWPTLCSLRQLLVDISRGFVISCGFYSVLYMYVHALSLGFSLSLSLSLSLSY